VTREQYVVQVGEWARDVSDEAIALYDRGAAPADCIRLAIAIRDSQQMKKNAMSAKLSLPGGAGSPRGAH
jgi:hypothetical protein